MKKMNIMKKNDQIKARKFCNIFRFTGNLNFLNYGGTLKLSFNIYLEELELVIKKILTDMKLAFWIQRLKLGM